MAEYLVLIYEDESAYADMSPADYQAVMDAHNRYPEQIAAAGGKLIGGKALQSSTAATSIRADIVTDGPFVETKEALGGYYLIEADNLDTALAIGKLCPATYGGVEVRPIMTFE